MDWQEHIAKVLVRLGFGPGRANPCAFRHERMKMFISVHVDEFLVLGRPTNLEWFKSELGKDFQYKAATLGEGEGRPMKYTTLTVLYDGRPMVSPMNTTYRLYERLVLEDVLGESMDREINDVFFPIAAKERVDDLSELLRVDAEYFQVLDMMILNFDNQREVKFLHGHHGLGKDPFNAHFEQFSQMCANLFDLEP